jgi:hypothetical protein
VIPQGFWITTISLIGSGGGPYTVSIRPWHEPTQGLAKNHPLVILFTWTRHGTDYFLGAAWRHRGGSWNMQMNTALIPMDE